MTTAETDLLVLEQEGDLASFCPRCHAGLDVYDARTKRVWIGLTVRVGETVCELLVNPRLDAFEHVCSNCWSDGTLADDVLCPHCQSSLLVAEHVCQECDAPVFSIEVSVRTRVAPLSLCARAGCHWHGVSTSAQAKIKSAAPRPKKPEQDAVLRVRNFAEVSYGYDGELAVAEASRCLQCKKPACVDGCPVAVDIPGFVKLIADGKFARAAQQIRLRNALPAICGRVCPQDEQ